MPGFWQTVPSAIVVLLALAQCSESGLPPDHAQPRPSIQLMTSLPLVWGEGASMESILSGEAEPAMIYRHWREHYDIMAVDSLENLAAENPDIVILAQPRAMDPADLADLDSWVRTGGRVIILTDPDLIWPSDLPFGDPRRPLVTGLLSPLLGHWGLELVAVAANRADKADMRLDQYSFASRGVGRLEPIESDTVTDVRCDFSDGGVMAQCSIGKGRAAIVADADFLDAALWPEESRRSPGNSEAVRFVDALLRDEIETAGGKP